MFSIIFLDIRMPCKVIHCCGLFQRNCSYLACYLSKWTVLAYMVPVPMNNPWPLNFVKGNFGILITYIHICIWIIINSNKKSSSIKSAWCYNEKSGIKPKISESGTLLLQVSCGIHNHWMDIYIYIYIYQRKTINELKSMKMYKNEKTEGLHRMIL